MHVKEGYSDGAREKERRGKTRSTSTDFLLTCYLLVRFTPTMDVDGWKQAAARGEGRKEGRKGWRSDGRWGWRTATLHLGRPRVRHPSISGTLFAHARGIYLKRKSELPLPAHARCTCARHTARTSTRHHLAALPLVLPWYPDSCKSSRHRVDRPTKLSRFVRLSSYEKLLVGCMGRTEESRNGGVNSEGYRSNLFVRGNDGRLRSFASTRYLIATFRSTV